MITLEALSSGVLPIVRNHSGFRELYARIRECIPEADLVFAGANERDIVRYFVETTTNAFGFAQPEKLATECRDLAIREFDWLGIARRVDAVLRAA
jgi:glycosyltransferase involved in cell wall biosynthesis